MSSNVIYLNTNVVEELIDHNAHIDAYRTIVVALHKQHGGGQRLIELLGLVKQIQEIEMCLPLGLDSYRDDVLFQRVLKYARSCTTDEEYEQITKSL